jgi:hypothetical protein
VSGGWREFTEERAAFREMQRRNAQAVQRVDRGCLPDLWVVVDGPADDVFTLMPLRDAVENEMQYRWGGCDCGLTNRSRGSIL